MDDATNIDGTYAFAGLTRYNDGDIPEKVRDHGSSLKWWAAETTGEDEPSADDRTVRLTASPGANEFEFRR